MNVRLHLYYLGFPTTWENVGNCSQYNSVKHLWKPIDIISEENAKCLVKELLLNDKEHRFKGIDFAKLFADILNDSSHINNVELRDVNIIYNIGAELANNKSYAGKVILNLIQKAKNFNKKIYLVGATKTSLQKEYLITL